jgi:hypothetical protein
MKRVEVEQLQSLPVKSVPRRYDESATPLSDLEPFAAQRGTGAPQPTYRKDRSFGDRPMTVGGKTYEKGLGCASNTVLAYDLGGRYERFRATVGVDDAMKDAANPAPSVCFTALVDGRLAFESGGMKGASSPKFVDVDVRGAKILMLRLSGNWDDGGKTDHDCGNWAEARLIGKAR